MISNSKLTVILLILSFNTFGQVQLEIAPPNNIKSIIFKGANDGDQFPVVKIGEAVYLSFDDLYADEADYYYKIEHCNYDWTLSGLIKSQYLNGLDNQRIQDYKNSLTTIQPYSNYQLQIPNNQTRLKLSGNYILKIFDNNDEIVFSRRFVIYKDLVTVGATVKRARDLSVIDQKQVIQLTVNSNNLQLINPQQEVKIAILQNYNWSTMITNIQPQFFSNNQLIYKYDKETRFNGGNEYLFIDTKEIRVANNAIARVELKEVYHQYLYTNTPRADEPYTYYPDINGNFFIRTLDGVDSDPYIEADYSYVHFSLPYDEIIGLDNIYVYGKFNNYQLSEENKLKFNPETGLLEGKLLLKQGFYNYKYVKTDEKGTVDYNFISGNKYQTENDYLVLVYYRNFGDLYDSIIGIGSTSSATITN
ncbi:DUF5103 domain-containing protein [Abyssalbus ytuae]|uniref:DUF5103 domain-containing protein n=1 Tax=Abyssalbus ytuae TaxID=2926907 RepID=A0A9E6ZT46_9FLAO|nr:DUF5103 domain-containing protein [Abyssalbus ytuae]UOB18363.1 DUF5103 domain-containing protein [Abyssalbus ytuae]